MIGVKQLPLFILKFCPLAGNYYLCIRYNHICLPLKPNLFIPKLDLFGGTSAFYRTAIKSNKIFLYQESANPATRFRKTCGKYAKSSYVLFDMRIHLLKRNPPLPENSPKNLQKFQPLRKRPVHRHSG